MSFRMAVLRREWVLLPVALAWCAAFAPGCDRGSARAPEVAAHGEPGAAHGPEGEHGEDAVVTLTPEAADNARLALGVAGAATIEVGVEAPGEVHLNAESVLEVRPRYGGVVREIRKRVGDHVRADEVVAVIQGNESLTDYDVVSPMAGSVIARPVVTGEAVDHESILLTVADLTSVWVEFAIYPQYSGRIRAGMPVRIRAHNRPDLSATGRIRYVGPLLEQDTRISSARVELPNPRGDWQPGLYVSAHVTLERVPAPVAVPEDALVRMPDGPAVFRAEGTRFTLTPVRTGRRDGQFTEILSGLAAGDSIVVANTFVLKSELGKGEAEHEH